MRPSFSPRLVNDPFGDPGLYVPFRFKGRALLFDLGDLGNLSSRELLKVSHVFVTHTHMDHFIGFDRLLRVLLGREKRLHLFGPEGFARNLAGKLAGYAWNLVDTGAYPLVVTATEVLADRMVTRSYHCSERFSPGPAVETAFAGALHSENSLTVSAAIFDHRIPCLGLALKERFHIHIMADRIEALGAAPGPWLSRFKSALYGRQPPGTVFPVPLKTGGDLRLPLAELAADIARISRGRKIAYVTDIAYSEKNLAKIVPLAEEADHLFIEAAFLDEDRQAARQKSHLTARQAGRIARLSKARRMTIFHFSPRYRGREAQIYREAEAAYRQGPSGSGSATGPTPAGR